MKKSKYVNQTFDNNWKCTAIYLAANYCKSTKHNAYRYQLERTTSDGKCEKIITVSGATMAKVAKGLTTVEAISVRKENRKTHKNTLTRNLYFFN